MGRLKAPGRSHELWRAVMCVKDGLALACPTVDAYDMSTILHAYRAGNDTFVEEVCGTVAALVDEARRSASVRPAMTAASLLGLLISRLSMRDLIESGIEEGIRTRNGLIDKRTEEVELYR